MNKAIQTLVATQFEAAGFKELGSDIRQSTSTTDVRKVVTKVMKHICTLDPKGFGQDMKNICNEGECTNG